MRIIKNRTEGGPHSIEVAFALLSQGPRFKSRVNSKPISNAYIRDFANAVSGKGPKPEISTAATKKYRTEKG